MSVVAAIRDLETNSIEFACDSQYTDGGRAHFNSEPKWIRGDTFILALTGKSLIRQLIREGNLFTHSVVTYETVCEFSTLLRTVVKDSGLQDEKFSILIGGSGNLFRINRYDVIEVEEYDSIGSGSYVALGSMYTSNGNPKLRAEKAVRAAIKWTPGVGGKIFNARI